MRKKRKCKIKLTFFKPTYINSEAKRRKDFLDARIIDHAASQVKPVDVKVKNEKVFSLCIF